MQVDKAALKLVSLGPKGIHHVYSFHVAYVVILHHQMGRGQGRVWYAWLPQMAPAPIAHASMKTGMGCLVSARIMYTRHLRIA